MMPSDIKVLQECMRCVGYGGGEEDRVHYMRSRERESKEIRLTEIKINLRKKNTHKHRREEASLLYIPVS